MKKKATETIEVAYKTAKGLHKAGAINDAEMLEFESLCFPKVKKLKPKEIKKIRLRLEIDVKTFAKILNTTHKSIENWEEGKNRPSGTALRLLNLVDEKGLGILCVDC